MMLMYSLYSSGLVPACCEYINTSFRFHQNQEFSEWFTEWLLVFTDLFYSVTNCTSDMTSEDVIVKMV